MLRATAPSLIAAPLVEARRIHSELQQLIGAEPPYRVGSLCRFFISSDVDAFHFRTDISGVLIRIAGSYHMAVNARHALVRRRFSAAHELYHYLRHRWEMDVLVCTSHPPPEMIAMEREANRFAAELLMPRQWMEHYHPGLELARLARRFGVSEAAMSRRLEEIGLARRSFRV